MSDSKDTKRTTRERAAQARAEQLAAEKRRERTVRIVGTIAVLAVVAAIIGLAVFASRSGSNDTASASSSPSADSNAALPKGVLAASDAKAPFGVPVGTAPKTAPVLEIWEDFQCPACAQVEKANGAGIVKLANDGKVQLIWRPTAFLDRNLNNDSSIRAVAAWGCAIDQGKAEEYHATVFANQPEKEGTGYTDDQLLAFGKDAGLSGAAYDTFAKCYTDRTYLGWANNSYNQFLQDGIPGTPNATLNGKDLPTATLVDEKALEAAIAGASASPAPSAS